MLVKLAVTLYFSEPVDVPDVEAQWLKAMDKLVEGEEVDHLLAVETGVKSPIPPDELR